MLNLLCGQAHTIYLGRWSRFTHEHEAIIQERREWRAARRAEASRSGRAAEVRECAELVESVRTARLGPWGITGRNGSMEESAMIQIENETGDLKREADDLVKAMHDVPKPTAAGPSMARPPEIAKLSPAAIPSDEGDLYHFSVGLIADAFSRNSKTGDR